MVPRQTEARFTTHEGPPEPKALLYRSIKSLDNLVCYYPIPNRILYFPEMKFLCKVKANKLMIIIMLTY